MNREALTPAEHFDALVETFVGTPDVTLPTDDPTAKRGFGSSALKVKDKIFAMLVNDRLVVKLPRMRVDTSSPLEMESASIRATMGA
jgi:hypothetical protein